MPEFWLMKLLGKMYKYEMDPTRTAGTTERRCDAGWTQDGWMNGWTNGQTDGRSKTNIPPTTSLCGGIKISLLTVQHHMPLPEAMLIYWQPYPWTQFQSALVKESIKWRAIIWMDKWTCDAGWTRDGWMNGWTNGQTDGRSETNIPPTTFLCGDIKISSLTVQHHMPLPEAMLIYWQRYFWTQFQSALVKESIKWRAIIWMDKWTQSTITSQIELTEMVAQDVRVTVGMFQHHWKRILSRNVENTICPIKCTQMCCSFFCFG